MRVIAASIFIILYYCAYKSCDLIVKSFHFDQKRRIYNRIKKKALYGFVLQTVRVFVFSWAATSVFIRFFNEDPFTAACWTMWILIIEALFQLYFLIRTRFFSFWKSLSGIIYLISMPVQLAVVFFTAVAGCLMVPVYGNGWLRLTADTVSSVKPLGAVLCLVIAVVITAIMRAVLLIADKKTNYAIDKVTYKYDRSRCDKYIANEEADFLERWADALSEAEVSTGIDPRSITRTIILEKHQGHDLFETVITAVLCRFFKAVAIKKNISIGVAQIKISVAREYYGIKEKIIPEHMTDIDQQILICAWCLKSMWDKWEDEKGSEFTVGLDRYSYTLLRYLGGWI